MTEALYERYKEALRRGHVAASVAGSTRPSMHTAKPPRVARTVPSRWSASARC